MSDVLDWSDTAGGNTQTPPDGSPEGQAPSTVNDSMREIMAAVKRFQQDQGGRFHVTAGTGNDYTVTLSQSITAYVVGQRFAIQVDRANTGPATLNINGIGAQDLTKVTGSGVNQPLSDGDLQPNMVIDVAYAAGVPRFELLSSTSRGGGLESGTRMLFQQTAAPIGWTKVTSGVDDRALRVTTGDAESGGTNGFTSVFADDRTTAGHALTVAEMPAHDHPIRVGTGGGFNSVQGAGTSPGTPVTAPIDNTGGGSEHDHDINLGVQFIDVIVAVRD